MFSLIITVISIALVSALVLATVYYGGAAFGQGAAQAEASKILLQGEQLLGAAELFYTENRRWPQSLNEMVALKYLVSIPVAAYQDGSTTSEASAARVSWTMPTDFKPVFVLPRVDSMDVCGLINLRGSARNASIKLKAYTGLVSQCFGAGPDFTAIFKKDVGDLSLAAAGVPPTEIIPGLPPVGPPQSALALAPIYEGINFSGRTQSLEPKFLPPGLQSPTILAGAGGNSIHNLYFQNLGTENLIIDDIIPSGGAVIRTNYCTEVSPAESCWIQFSVDGAVPQPARLASIKATYHKAGGVSATSAANFSYEVAPYITVSSVVVFDNWLMAGVRENISFEVRNNVPQPLGFQLFSSGLEPGSTSPVSNSPNCQGMQIAALGTCTVTLGVEASLAQALLGSLAPAEVTVYTSAASYRVPIQANVMSLGLSTQTDQWVYVPVGSVYQSTYTVTNTGGLDLSGFTWGITAHTSQYAITGTTCSSSLPVGASCTFDLRYSPTSPGVHDSALKFNWTGKNPVDNAYDTARLRWSTRVLDRINLQGSAIP